MRFAICAALALLVALPARAADADAYGEKVCRQNGPKIPIDCACAGPLLEEEFDQDELVMLIAFLNNANDPNASFDDLMAMEKKIGEKKLNDLGQRFDKLAAGDLKVCLKK
jgi:hypothetical protein